jgi:hypothetical protein
MANTLAAEPLLLLLGARSKEVLARVLQDVFDCRFQGWTRDRRARVRDELTLQDDEQADAVRCSVPCIALCCAAAEPLRALAFFSAQLFEALVQLVRCALSSAPGDDAWLDTALAEDFHPKLRTRLAKALALALPGWREASVLSQVRAPPMPARAAVLRALCAASC